MPTCCPTWSRPWRISTATRPERGGARQEAPGGSRTLSCRAQRAHPQRRPVDPRLLPLREGRRVRRQDNQVLIVDEFTGRILPGRRWSDGLHQAVEAKEGVKIERETQTLATITIQNYFRMYKKLAGMTGTAETEAGRVPRDLQAGRGGHPDQPAGAPGRRTT
jgi:hypothetical protein